MNTKNTKDFKEPLFDIRTLRKFNKLYEDFRNNNDNETLFEPNNNNLDDSCSSSRSKDSSLRNPDNRFHPNEGDEYLEQKRRKIRNKYFIHSDNVSYDNRTKPRMQSSQGKLPLVKGASKPPKVSSSSKGYFPKPPKTGSKNFGKANGSEVSDIDNHMRKTVKKRLKGMSIFLFKNDFNHNDGDEYNELEKINKINDININYGKIEPLINTKSSNNILGSKYSIGDLRNVKTSKSAKSMKI